MLNFMTREITNLGIPYAFMRWNKAVENTYWIGEYIETATVNEDGCEEYSFILTGTTRGTWEELEREKEIIKRHFPSVGGLHGKTENGRIVVFYENATPVDTGDANLKRIQVNLSIKEWRTIT